MVAIANSGRVGMLMFVILLCGGYVSLFHVVLLFTGVLGGVDGIDCIWYCDICVLSIVVLILFI